MTDMTLIYIIVNLVIGVVGFLIRAHIMEVKNDVKEIKIQTNLTNGRVGVLEEWKKNHIESDKTLHNKIDDAYGILADKLDQLWKGSGR